MAESFFEQGAPPERLYRGFVRRVKVGEDVHCTVISPCFWKTWVHYHGRSIPCYRNKEKCPGCKLAYPRKVLSYLYIWNEQTHKHEHLELPRDASNDLLEAVGELTLIRGSRFHAKRKGQKKGPIKFDLKARIDAVAPGFVLGDDCSPSSILEYLWGVNVAKLHLFAGDASEVDDSEVSA